MSKLILLVFLMPMIFACKKSDTTTETIAPKADTASDAPVTECYTYVTQRDTIMMTMLRDGITATGQLTYSIYEKDRNTGDYKGSFKGDTLRIGYTFQSEGMRSVREELFLLKGTELIKGSGNIVEKGTRQVFENRSDVVFDRSIVLTKSDCKAYN